VDRRHVCLVARQTGKRFYDDGIEATVLRGLHQRKQAVALKHALARDLAVDKDFSDLVAVSLGERAAMRHLVVNRPFPLKIA